MDGGVAEEDAGLLLQVGPWVPPISYLRCGMTSWA
jgi:hypothetical protein